MAVPTNGIKADGAGVKMEDVSTFKNEDMASPGRFMDDDEYEDTGELAMPKEVTDSYGVWLTRIPNYLWDAWSGIDEDEKIEIGKIRVYEGENNRTNGDQKMKMVLHQDVKYHRDVPKEYDVNVITMQSKNTFVFSEKDQPGYKPQNRSKPSFQQPSDPRTGDKRKRPYGASIPKQTSLVGFAKHEVNCLAVENDEYNRLMAARTAKMFAPKHTTTILSAGDDKMIRRVAAAQPQKFDSFIKTAERPAKKRAHDNKYIRMPQNQLIDELLKCFRVYKYWHIKSLRQRLQQPESYLKDTLGHIAQLTKQGHFTNTYSLLPEYQQQYYGDLNIKEEAAPDTGGADEGDGEGTADDEGDAGGGDDDDDEVKMEDVAI